MAQAVKTRVDAPNPRGEKYQRILDAAICVIAEKGFFQARVAEIAERAGVADGTIYLYFKNKEQILMAAIDYAFTIFMNAAKTELATITDPRQRLTRLADDQKLREEFARNGREFVRQNFAVEKMVDDIHALYQRLLASP